MRESRLYGSVRGALGDRRPYRDTDLWGAWRVTAGSTRQPKSLVLQIHTVPVFRLRFQIEGFDGNTAR